MESQDNDSENSKLLYLFGIANNGSIILTFDPVNESFSSLPLPSEINLGRYMSAIQYSPDEIFISGGINSDLSAIKKDLYLYNPKSGEGKVLPSFNQPRYTHSSIIHNGKLFLMGGRFYGTDFESLLCHTEQYDIEEQTWQTMAPMNKRRCTFFTFIYKDQIHVCGGYSGSFKRTTKIERFHETKNFWEVLDVKLGRGLEAGLIFPHSSNKFMIFGGNSKTGPTSRCSIYNLESSTMKNFPRMKSGRVLQKGVARDDNVYVFGGDIEGLVEKFSISGEYWSVINSAYIHFVSPEEIKSFSSAIYSTQIDDQHLQPFYDDFEGERIFFFGNDYHPFIMEARVMEEEVIHREVPLGISLLAYQGGIRLSETEFFLMGGITSSLDKISKCSWSYNIRENKAKKLAKMNRERYAFPIVFCDPFVYVFGGRTYQQDEFALLQLCERYDLTSGKWEQICSMNEKKCSCSAFIFKEEIYLTGGYLGEGKRSELIEKYSQEYDEWVIINYSLPIPLEASFPLVVNDNLVLLFGGKSNNGDEENIYSLNFEGEPEVYANMDSARCLVKAYRMYDNRNILILGGKANEEGSVVSVLNTETREIDNSEKSFFLERINEGFKSIGLEIDTKTYLMLG